MLFQIKVIEKCAWKKGFLDDEYQRGKKSASQPLKSCLYLNGPRAN